MPRPARPADVRTLMRRDAFARGVGVRLVEVGPGFARTRLRLGPEHLNGVGVAQGGAVFTLADLAFAAAANSRGAVAVALDVSITFARAALAGTTLEAEAREESLGRRIAVVALRSRDAAFSCDATTGWAIRFSSFAMRLF